VAEPDDAPCSIARSLEVIGDRWTILILRDAFRGIRRFDDFRRDLEIARPVLADRLRKLVDAGVMTKVAYQDHPPWASSSRPPSSRSCAGATRG
jgi:DNA-binding HxlR family transcriptional regulator